MTAPHDPAPGAPREPAAAAAEDAPSAASTSPATSAGRRFPCDSCGADLEFHIGAQRLKCPYCAFEKDLAPPERVLVEENCLDAALERLRKQCRKVAAAAAPRTREVDCGACGATTSFEGSLATWECAFCGSPLQDSSAHSAPERLAVDGLLPFAIPRQTAHENLTAWVKSRWFAPNAFKKRGVTGKFSGVYLPYFTFDALTFSRYTGQRGTNYTVVEGSGKNRRTVTKVRWTPVSGSVQRFFDDVLVCAARGLRAKLVRALEPWPLARVQPYRPEALAGYQSRVYELDLPECFGTGQQIMAEEIRRAVRRDIGGNHQRIESLHTEWSALKYKHLLLPVWMMAYRFHDRVFQLYVNAQTGEVQGERPWSRVKLTLAALAAAALIGAVVWAANR